MYKRQVQVSTDRNRLNIIEDGLREFLERYSDTVYEDGTTAKIAIYCGQIKTLEEEVYPLVEQISVEYGLNPSTSILKYYRSNKEYSLPAENEMCIRDRLRLIYSLKLNIKLSH